MVQALITLGILGIQEEREDTSHVLDESAEYNFALHILREVCFLHYALVHYHSFV